ncbi:hypothetical protein [Streptomyces chartreusis]|uniref:hypothetical protein n=1 Tax=Streptomyces chartreusis TaxID=1969 RepID=UPI0038292A12
MVLAGRLEDFGNSLLNMFGDWSAKGLQVGLTCLVVIIMVQRVSPCMDGLDGGADAVG